MGFPLFDLNGFAIQLHKILLRVDEILHACRSFQDLHLQWPIPVVSKQAGDPRSSAGYLIVCRRLLWSQQSARDKQSRRCLLSLRQHGNFTLNFAAIIHTQKDVSVVKKKTQMVRYILCRTHLCFVA